MGIRAGRSERLTASMFTRVSALTLSLMFSLLFSLLVVALLFSLLVALLLVVVLLVALLMTQLVQFNAVLRIPALFSLPPVSDRSDPRPTLVLALDPVYNPAQHIHGSEGPEDPDNDPKRVTSLCIPR